MNLKSNLTEHNQEQPNKFFMHLSSDFVQGKNIT